MKKSLCLIIATCLLLALCHQARSQNFVYGMKGHGGSGNATVPNDAPIQPPQAFVDYVMDSLVNNDPHVINFSLAGKNVTAAYVWISNNLVEDFFNNTVPGIDLSENDLPSSQVESIISLAALPPLGLAAGDNSYIIDVSGGTSASPNNDLVASGAADTLLWTHDPGFVIKVNIHGSPASIDPYGVFLVSGKGVCNFRGTNMTTVEVNALLSFLVAGPIGDYTPAPRLLLDGAGMGAPTGQGLIDKATLIVNGWTVTTN